MLALGVDHGLRSGRPDPGGSAVGPRRATIIRAAGSERRSKSDGSARRSLAGERLTAAPSDAVDAGSGPGAEASRGRAPPGRAGPAETRSILFSATSTGVLSGESPRAAPRPRLREAVRAVRRRARGPLAAMIAGCGACPLPRPSRSSCAVPRCRRDAPAHLHVDQRLHVVARGPVHLAHDRAVLLEQALKSELLPAFVRPASATRAPSW